MKKQNGYTVIELISLIIVLGVATIIVLAKTSYAFKDPNDLVRYNQDKVIISQAKAYGESIKEDLKDEPTKIILVQTLIDEGYLSANSEGKIISATDETADINGNKIEIIYNTTNDSIKIIYPK